MEMPCLALGYSTGIVLGVLESWAQNAAIYLETGGQRPLITSDMGDNGIMDESPHLSWIRGLSCFSSMQLVF